ncbi:T9SS type A sorting domain-containing protein [Flavobacterium procerum]|uniref:T9SS type A sorting domain-containing protein n=1 Tax=Flavobacterium procerum TaxID=1455569 RepID=A0ABV6BPK5_9FLAO
MKKNYIFLLLLVFIVFFNNVAVSQTSLGKCNSFINKLKKELNVSTGKKAIKNIELKISDSKSFSGKINYKESSVSSEYLIGEINNVSESSFYLKVMEQSLEGHIILKKSKEAYKYSSDANGNAYVSKVDINSLICVDYATLSQKEAKAAKVSSTAAISPELLKLESLPGGIGCILLDFDGYNMPAGNLWNNGGRIYADPSGMSDANILQCFEIVSEDFRPFNLNITTNEAVFNTYPKTKRKRIVITPTDTAQPGVGGIAFIGAFTANNDVPAWCFNVSTGKAAGDTSSHEIGHLFSLQHDGRRTSPSEEYFAGLSGTSWGPIMGMAVLRPVVQWSKGEYTGANNTEDDVAIISNISNGIGYRADDYGNDTTSAFNLTVNSQGDVMQREGVIEKETDKDFFAFTTRGGSIRIAANTIVGDGSGNLHIFMQLYNSAGVEIEKHWYADPSSLNAVIYADDIPAGKYFVSISGVGAGDKANGGYSAYGSIGSYTISGFVPPSEDIFISGSQTNVSCYGASDGSITISASGGDGNFTYAWSPSGGTGATASGLKAGNYTVIVTDKNGVFAKQSFTITEPAMLDSSVTVGSDKLTANQSGAIYQWIECPASLLVGETNQSFKPKKAGSYKVLVSTDKCNVFSECVNFNNLNTPSFEQGLKFKLYPNPSSKVITIRSDYDADFKFINALGETVKTVKVLADTNNEIDIENLSSGIYFICEIKEGKLISHKFIKN